MSDKLRVVVDGMGGDHAPNEIVKGTVDAVKENPGIVVIITGPEETIKKELKAYEYPQEQIEVVNATEVISTEETPVAAIRKKKDSSLVIGVNIVKSGGADAFVSAGSTGAIMAGGTLIVGRQKGVERPPLGTLVPTAKDMCLLLDSGANVDSKASHLVQFAQMGSIYMQHALKIKNPSVALLNIGVEEEKGNSLSKEAYGLLKELTSVNFIGNIEAREVPRGGADVVICDGFAGNVLLKTFEGTALTLMSIIKQGMLTDTRSKLGALLVKPALKKTIKRFDASEYGGAPLLGLKGLVVKAHGNATAKEIKNAIFQCLTFKEENVNERIGECFIKPEHI